MKCVWGGGGGRNNFPSPCCVERDTSPCAAGIGCDCNYGAASSRRPATMLVFSIAPRSPSSVSASATTVECAWPHRHVDGDGCWSLLSDDFGHGDRRLAVWPVADISSRLYGHDAGSSRRSPSGRCLHRFSPAGR